MRNSNYEVETRVDHRDDPRGLFIGTSMLLLALMNSAPAELLHPLMHAALQPHLTACAPCPPLLRIGGKHCALARRSQKNTGTRAGVGILFLGNQPVFQRKSRLARRGRGKRRNYRRAIRSSTVH